eukprot:gene15089-17290_t
MGQAGVPAGGGTGSAGTGLGLALVRRICGHCVRSAPASEEAVEELLADYLHAFPAEEIPARRQATLDGWLQRFGRDGRLHLHSGAGCEHCAKTGFRGRVGIHELMTVSKELRRLVQGGARAEELLQAALKEGMRTLRQDGIEKVLAGQTTIEEGAPQSNRPLASAAAAARVSTPSFSKMCSRCLFTVRGLVPRISPMSRLVLPLASHDSTSVSRGVSAASASRADEALTSTLKAALALVDVRVLDHVIV